MIKLGKTQTLTVARKTDFGVYLFDDYGSREDQVLLPKSQVPATMEVDDEIDVFIYKDSEDRIIATTTIPALEIGQVASLKVVQNTKIGAFLDWGLQKDLLLPFKEQTTKVKPGDECLVALYIDKSERLCATMKVYQYLKKGAPYQKDDQVEGIVYEVSENFGTFVAIDNQYSALIPKREGNPGLHVGDRVHARVTEVKPDGKISLSVREKAFLQMDKDALMIMKRLEKCGGKLPFNDKADAELIKEEFGLSKNAFKRAVGRLYKERKIEILENGIKLK